MPDHVRTTIRDTVVTLLTGLQTTGSRVYAGRTRALAEGHDPTLLIYTRRDRRWQDGDTMRGDNPIAGRDLTLIVEARVTKTGATAAADAEDALDQIENEVIPPLINAILSEAGALRALATTITWEGSEIEVAAEGERHIGMNRMEFSVLYRIRENAPSVPA